VTGQGVFVPAQSKKWAPVFGQIARLNQRNPKSGYRFLDKLRARTRAIQKVGTGFWTNCAPEPAQSKKWVPVFGQIARQNQSDPVRFSGRWPTEAGRNKNIQQGETCWISLTL